MTQRSAKHKKKSLCEKSMLLVSNIVKLSSLSFVAASVRTSKNTSVGSVEAAEKKRVSGSACGKVDQSTCRLSQRSQEPESGLTLKPRPYLMEPQNGNYSSLYVTQEKKDNIDDIADEFIRRTHEKIKKSGSKATNKAVLKEITIF